MGIIAMRKTSKFLARFCREESGAVGTEYGVLLVIIALGMAIGATVLGQAITAALNEGANCLNSGTGCTTG